MMTLVSIKWHTVIAMNYSTITVEKASSSPPNKLGKKPSCMPVENAATRYCFSKDRPCISTK